jgi:hypothetical protein
MSKSVVTGPITTKSGRVLSEADIVDLAKRAEEGFDLSSWTPRRGRPSLGAAVGHLPRIEARVPEALHRRGSARAAREGRSVSQVVRSLLEEYAREPQ